MDPEIRIREPEIMDRQDLDPLEHRHALRGLARLNIAAASARAKRAPILALARGSSRTLRVLDVACGAGDGIVALAKDRALARLPLEFHGCDRSEVAVMHAREYAKACGANVTFHPCDVLNDDLSTLAPDVIVNSLFLHHLDAGDASRFVRRMCDAARLAFIAVDLLRTRLGFALAYLASRLLTTSHIVRFDALASVRAAYSLDEVNAIIADSGVTNARVESVWPERYRIEWRRE